jgi:putative peptide zinc metalloprotease protein
VQSYEHGTLVGFVQSPIGAARSVQPIGVALAPGRHLAIAMIPVGGATKAHPAFYFIPGKDGQPGTGILDTGGRRSTAFPFTLPSTPRPGDTQALAVNTTDGTVVYKVAYSLVTVQDGGDVTNANSAFAFASCKSCAAIAVSFQVVLVVGESRNIAPINVAGALNANCPACVTVAVAHQIVVTLSSQPTAELAAKLRAALQQLDAVSTLTSVTDIGNLVDSVQKQIDDALQQSGQLATPTTTTKPATTTTATTSTSTTPASTAPAQSATTTTTSAQTQTTTTTQATTTATTTTAQTTTARTTTESTTTTSTGTTTTTGSTTTTP